MPVQHINCCATLVSCICYHREHFVITHTTQKQHNRVLMSVDQQVMDSANIPNCPERERNVVLLLAEMHIREDLVYNKYFISVVTRYQSHWRLIQGVKKILVALC